MIPDNITHDEWLACRIGKVTASRIADLTAATKSGWGASRDNYMAQLIVERLTLEQSAGYVNTAMLWGIETEPQAIAAYEFYNDVIVTPSAFVDHPTIPMSGASPDGEVNDDGLIEVKCPETKTHIDTLLNPTIPGKYTKQMQWQMACTGRKWCQWVSFDPRLPADLQYYSVRVERDDKMIAELEDQVIVFIAELESKIKRLLERK